MATDDFFRARLDQMIDLRHPLAVLAQRMPWAQLEAVRAPAFARRDHPGKAVAGSDLFGTTLEMAGVGVSAAGRPRLPIRLMAALRYLKHAFNLSDEELVVRWSENVVWQYFSGLAYYTPKLPCDATQIGRFRSAIGKAGVEELAQGHDRRGGAAEGGRAGRIRARDRRHHGTGETGILLEDAGAVPKQVVVDLGFRGVDRDNPKVQILHRGKI